MDTLNRPQFPITSNLTCSNHHHGLRCHLWPAIRQPRANLTFVRFLMWPHECIFCSAPPPPLVSYSPPQQICGFRTGCFFCRPWECFLGKVMPFEKAARRFLCPFPRVAECVLRVRNSPCAHTGFLLLYLGERRRKRSIFDLLSVHPSSDLTYI